MATDSSGNPADVASGELIDSPWGNAVQERVVRIFPSITARDQWTDPLNGAVCFVTATDRNYRRRAGVWETMPLVVAGITAATGDAAGNANIFYTRVLPAAPSVVLMSCLDFGNVAVFAFNPRTDGTQVALRRPADNTPVVGIAVSVGYIAVLQ